MKNKILFSLTLLVLLAVGLMSLTSTANADTINGENVKQTISYTYNGVERTVIILDDELGSAYIKVGDSVPEHFDHSIASIGFDRNATIWYTLSNVTDYVLPYVNYDLYGSCPSLLTYYNAGEEEFVTDVASLVFDEQNFVIGYITLSGEFRPTLSLDELLELYPSDNPKPEATPGSAPVYIPERDTSTDVPLPNPTGTPSNTSTPVPVATNSPTPRPTLTPNPTSIPAPTASSKISIKKKGSYTYLYNGTKVVSKFGIKSGTLKWAITKGNGKSKTGKFKKVKSAGLIKKSNNIIFMTKSKKVYTISFKTGKRKLIAKNAKKLVTKGKYVTKVKKTNGKYINVTKK